MAVLVKRHGPPRSLDDTTVHRFAREGAAATLTIGHKLPDKRWSISAQYTPAR